MNYKAVNILVDSLDKFNIDIETLKRGRHQEKVAMRQIIYIKMYEAGVNQEKIGEIFGRERSTVSKMITNGRRSISVNDKIITHYKDIYER